MKIVSYIRVSTARQGASGLGLAGQTTAIEAYAAANAAQIVGAFTEVESGRKNDRPELAKAMKLARVTGATLVIARLDRLSRSAAFLLSLQESGVDFVCCDNPHATLLTIGVLALVAQTEAEAISARIKAALAATKAKGTKLGNPNGAAALRRAGKGNSASVQVMKDRANARANDLAEVIDDLETHGFRTLNEQANELNKRGIKTARGGQWHPSSVSNLRKRLAQVA
ncbi:recombinase family protein [Ruegeria meonggei]|uniref:recombinase family protein n=1 Tax=Ruegeria meonggei TaxID=1446476 RepID=UPI00366BBEB9